MSTLRKKAMDYLARREHSRLELKQKLIAKNFSDIEIEKTLDQLTQDNLQSDARFACAYVRYRRQAGFGPNRIELELRERGVANGLITDALDGRSPEWQKHMIEVWQKKFPKFPKNQAEKAAQFRFLSYRGYNAEEIWALLTQKLKEASLRAD